MAARWRDRLALGLLVAAFVPAYGAEIEGGLQIGLSRTDNALLATSPNAVDDLVYSVSPFLDFTHESPRLDAYLNYRFDWYRYDDLAITSSYHMGEASLTPKFWQEALELEFGARRNQVLRDPGGNIPPGSLPISGNLLDRDEIYANPRLEKKLGGSITANADYRYSDGRYDDELTQDDTSQHGQFTLENYDRGQGMTWALRYDWRKTEYEFSPAWEYQRVGAELGFWVNSAMRLFAEGGEESPWDDPFNADLEEGFWEAGFAFKGSQDLSIELAAGERSFGTSWRGNVDYTFRRGHTLLSYSESPTTTGFNQSGRQRIAFDSEQLDDFLDTPGLAERYLSKRLQWELNVEFRRTGMTFSLFDEDRIDRVLADGTPVEDEAQRGARLALSWKVGVRTEITGSGSIIRRELAEASSSDFYTVGLDANYRLGNHSQLTLAYSYTEQQPKGLNAQAQDYVANVVSLLFVYSM